ncbi:MAG: FGGY-family carbohydrate kinase [Chloroflexota bacterium]
MTSSGAGTPAVLAFDLGTSELKAALVGLDGELLAIEGRGYALDVDPATGTAEQDPADWWEAAGSVSTALLRAVPNVSVAGVSMVGQGPTLVAADADAAPTRPAVTWLDTRAARETADLEAAAGMGGWTLGPLAAALRIERFEPGVASRTRWYLNSWEWLAFRMTDVAATTLSEGQVIAPPEPLVSAGLPAHKHPPRVAAGSVMGTLTDASARHLGLSPGIPVVAGTVDAYGSVIGAGLVDPGDAIDTGGTSGGFGVIWDRPITIGGAFASAAPLPGRWLYGGAMSSTGKALDWLRESILAGTASVDELLAEAARVPAGADGLVFLPYLAGERSPIWDPTARGVLAGLSLRHGRAHLVRAVIEAAAMALRHVASVVRGAGVEVRELRVSGGPARSMLWNQVKADVLGVPVAVPVVRETAAYGAALIAIVGVGAEPDLETALRRLVRIATRVEPDAVNRPTYDRLYDAYLTLHPAVAPIVRALQAPSETPVGAAIDVVPREPAVVAAEQGAA